MAKAKKKRAVRSQKKNTSQEEVTDSAAVMSECAALCQEERWREALHLCRSRRMKAERDGNKETAESLKAAEPKLAYSLSRQMVAAMISSTKDVLSKEYLLDVQE